MELGFRVDEKDFCFLCSRDDIEHVGKPGLGNPVIKDNTFQLDVVDA